jgi:Sec-independent protein secretion pathway component TatC
MFSAPWIALSGFIRKCTFEVFVEAIDQMSYGLAPALTVLLPTVFLSLSLAAFETYRSSHVLFYLNATALALFGGALLTAVVFELPLVEEILTWAALAEPGDWRRTRGRWLNFHIVRVALTLASLILLLVAGCIQLFRGLSSEHPNL